MLCGILFIVPLVIGIIVGIKYYHPNSINELSSRKFSNYPNMSQFSNWVDIWLRSLWSFFYATKSQSYRVTINLEAVLELPSFFSSSNHHQNSNKNTLREYVLDLEDIDKTGNQAHDLKDLQCISKLNANKMQRSNIPWRQLQSNNASVKSTLSFLDWFVMFATVKQWVHF